MEVNRIILGDCLEVMRTFPDGSIDTVITDPPYGLSFMGKKWDYDVPSVEVWIACLRVLKPGGTLLCFAGARTQHRMAVNVEDAGFILKDCIPYFFEPDVLAFFECLNKDQQQAFLSLYGGPEMFWLYGSGFPKATDISKQIDKQAGVERKVVGVDKAKYRKDNDTCNTYAKHCGQTGNITAPATEAAKLWDGWKSHGLKPAYEPILVAMKSNDGSYANNALKHGVAGLNIDAGRIPHDEPVKITERQKNTGIGWHKGNCGLRSNPTKIASPDDKGRYPANVILDEAAAAMLDEQSGILKSGDLTGQPRGENKNCFGSAGTTIGNPRFFKGDTGGASRFFYCAKASKSERNEGCEGMEEKVKDAEYRQPTGDAMVDRIHGCGKKSHNHHPTVKPVALMEYLCRLTSTPTGGLVLDPFAGSGTTCIAVYRTGRDYIGIEKEPEYKAIAEKRIKAEKAKLGLFADCGEKYEV